MADRVRREDYPLWVKIAILGVPGRGGMWAFVVLSLILAAACVACGFLDPVFFFGALFIVSALWYLLAIRWVDAHGSWPASPSGGPRAPT